MIRYLLPKNGNFYKANLHCHTNLSDGSLSPKEVKELYMKNGYSIVAFTDHDILIPHRELADESFLPLLGFEVEINEDIDEPFSQIKSCHICFIALDPDNDIQPCFNPNDLFGNAPKYLDQIKYDKTKPYYIRKYSPEKISEIMSICRKSGFFVTYNHPTWSLENYNDYINYNNMHAMEIMNYSSIVTGFDDYNTRVYDDMLRAGKMIYCIGADDNHNRRPFSRHHDSCGAWTVFKADSLDYLTITNALKKGEFYSSEGPEIYNIYAEGNKLIVECSDADKIIFNYSNRRAECFYANDDENASELNGAAGSIYPDSEYIRITIVDKFGKRAFSNAYPTKELL